MEHLRRGIPAFSAALENGHVSIHTVVLGELACGNLRKQTQRWLAAQPPARQGRKLRRVLDFIEVRRLHGRGFGWSDVQLLVSARLSGDSLWSLDDRLAAVAAGQASPMLIADRLRKDFIKAWQTTVMSRNSFVSQGRHRVSRVMFGVLAEQSSTNNQTRPG